MIEYDKEIKLSQSLTNGYQYFCDSHHPLSTQGGWVYYHRHVASIKMGRWISSEEHVHHIDGNELNNDPSNLEVLSASEHSVLENHNRGNYKIDYFCINCGKELIKSKDGGITKLCFDCCYKSKRKFNPSEEELKKLVWEMPMTKVAKLFDVSDKAIKKRCKFLSIETPPQGYWLRN